MMLRFCVKILWGKERKGREKLSSGGTDETILAVMVTAELHDGTWTHYTLLSTCVYICIFK